ncbi:MAG: RNA chaperone Hfq [Microcoleaceae cyanobacterium]
MSEFDVSLPSVRQVQAWIKEKHPVEIKLVNGDVLLGSILWQDQNCICLDSQGQKTMAYRQAIAYVQPKG